MERVGRFLYKTKRGHGYWCPGCQATHSVYDDGGTEPQWTFDGDAEAPSFNPSVRHFVPRLPAHGEYAAQPERTTCHYFIKRGHFNFCRDCEHDLAGAQGIPMVDLSTIKGYGFGDAL